MILTYFGFLQNYIDSKVEYCCNKIEGVETDFETLAVNELMDDLKKYDLEIENDQQKTSTTSNDEELNKIKQEING